jgi:Tol biopolymer transport system component
MTRFAPLLFSLVLAAGAAAQSSPGQRIALPEEHLIGAADRPAVAISPDGTQFVYVANNRLYLRSVGNGQPSEIPGSMIRQGVSNPIFAADGRSILFWSGLDRMIERIAVSGGKPTPICAADNPFGMSWAPNGTLLIGQGPKGILRVAANGGTPETLIRVADGELAYGPQMLPGGDAVLFTVIDAKTALASGWDKASIVVQPIPGGMRKTVVEAGRDGRITPNGYLLYALNERLMAVRFDAKQRQTTGAAATVAGDVRMSGPTGAAQFSVADSGAMVYLPERSGETQLGLVSLDGTRKMIGTVTNGGPTPRLSSDGKRVAWAVDGNIWMADVDNLSGMRKIIRGTSWNFPVFSEDGKRLLLGTILPNGLETVYMTNSDGTGDIDILARPGRAPESWIRGTEMFSMISHKGRLDYDLWTYNVPDHNMTPLARIPVSAQLSSQFSPDGHWFAYMSNESGEFQIYVEPWPQTGAKFQATKSGGVTPMWSADSTEIYYENGTHMYAVTFTNGVTMFGQPRELPISGFVPAGLRRNFDLMPDFKTFLMVFRSPAQVSVVPKWNAALKE